MYDLLNAVRAIKTKANDHTIAVAIVHGFWMKKVRDGGTIQLSFESCRRRLSGLI
jgi:hypothetical protein